MSWGPYAIESGQDPFIDGPEVEYKSFLMDIGFGGHIRTYLSSGFSSNGGKGHWTTTGTPAENYLNLCPGFTNVKTQTVIMPRTKCWAESTGAAAHYICEKPKEG